MERNLKEILGGSEIGEAALHYVEDIFSTLQISGTPEITLLQFLAPQTKCIQVHGAYVDSVGKPLTEKEELEPIKKEAMAY